MQYKTIVLELIQDRPDLHQQLKSSNSLLSTINQLAGTLRTMHLAMIDRLKQAHPQTDSAQLSSEAMELALDQLQEALPSHPLSEEPINLDVAMQYIRSRIPPE